MSASVITSQRQSCALLAVGACIASRTHSRMTSGSTGRVRSRRLRTARVVVSSSSTEEVSTVFRQTSIAQGWSTPRTVNDRSQAEEDGNAQREVEDLLVGEQRAQSPE